VAASLFISYSRADQARTRELIDELRKQASIDVFDYLDRYSADEHNWQSRITAAIHSALGVIVVYSPSYQRSPNCMAELARCRELACRRVLLLELAGARSGYRNTVKWDDYLPASFLSDAVFRYFELGKGSPQ
jgi:hypothetical protein